MVGHRIRVLTRVSILLVLIVPAWAGAQDMLKMCTKCHGEDGLGTESDMPIIAGLEAAIQEDALFAYADGGRNCSATPMMCKMVSRLTEEQIIEYAAHFAALPYKASGEEFDAALAQAGKKIHQNGCARCHGPEWLCPMPRCRSPQRSGRRFRSNNSARTAQKLLALCARAVRNRRKTATASNGKSDDAAFRR